MKQSGEEMKTVKAEPIASMLIESMRDFGYSLETAMADVIDNAITARARNIKIFAEIEDTGARIGIVDDGAGMSESDLLMAMRLGSNNPLQKRTISDLGRFGLGLKTASFSQCRRLTVISRNNGKTCAAIWDLDHVTATNEWQVIIPDKPADIPWFDEIEDSGTLVLWENLDRITEKASVDIARNHFNQRLVDAGDHIELVFHRFLTGEPGIKKIKIFLNNRALEAFDPFHSNHPATIHGPKESIPLGDQEVIVQAFTLPHHKKVTRSDWEKYAGKAGYLKNQGFYVYREKRLIIYSTWFRLARQMELTKLTRVRIDISNSLDSEWKIDVKKSSAQLPYQVRERLRKIIEAIGADSRRVYKGRGKILATDKRLPFWNRILDKEEIIYRVNPAHPMIIDFVSRLPDQMKNEFLHFLELAGTTLPLDSLLADLSGVPEKVKTDKTSDDTLQYNLNIAYETLSRTVKNKEDIADMLRLIDPFRSNWPRTEQLLSEICEKENANG